MDRLIALVGLRLKLELRGLLGRRERAVFVLLALPGLLLGAAFTSALAFFGVRALARAEPGLVLPVLSAAATLLGLVWALSPLLTGLALAETHDLTRLLAFPVPFRTLLVSSLLANLVEPAALAKVPMVVAAGVALGGPGAALPVVLACGLLALVFMLAVAQTAGLALHTLARNRRLHDRALFLGIGLGFVVSLLPMLLLFGGQSLRGAALGLLTADVFALSPWAWPVRAAVHASRGELLPALGLVTAAFAALVLVIGTNAWVARRLYQGDVDLGPARRESGEKRRLFALPGAVGVLMEKDLRLYWRDPRLKAMLLTSILSPVVLLLLWRGTAGRPATGFLVFLAAFSGLGALGGNAFALERRGVLLLFSFGVDRFALLVGKNLAAMALRLPALLALAVMAALLAPGGLLVPLAATTVIALFLGAGTDNFLSILYPVPVPAAGGNPYGPSSGGRGLGAALATAVLMAAALALCAPFIFLAFLPVLLERRGLLLATVPLAVAGAVAVYLLLVAAAERLLRPREPELVARVLAEE